MSTDPRFLPIVPFATTSHAKFYPRGPFISITLAQWALESAYGTRLSGHNNPFGIKANAQQIAANNFTEVWTKEYTSGAYRSELLRFANYPSLVEAFDAHALLLSQSGYADCIDAATPDDYARALQLDGYATLFGITPKF